nr:uncharacterized protein LOC117276717 [Nicotiana tomentosiformis]
MVDLTIGKLKETVWKNRAFLITLRATEWLQSEDAWSAEFEQLCQGAMIISEYVLRSNELSSGIPVTPRSQVSIMNHHYLVHLQHRVLSPVSPADQARASFNSHVLRELVLSVMILVIWTVGDSIHVDCVYQSFLVVIGRGTLDHVPNKVVSFLKSRRMVAKGCDPYLAFMRDVSVDTPTVESVSVDKYYLDVILSDLPGMPPYGDINFGMGLLSGTQPISIPPYHMASAEVNELK